ISLKDADLGMPEGLSANVVYRYEQAGTEVDPINVGTYTVSAILSTKNDNYALPADYSITGTLTITPKALEITLNDTAKTSSIYGEEIASYVKDTDFTVVGIVERDEAKDLGITVKAYKEYVEATETEVASKIELQAGDNVGTYPIKAEVADSNYTVVFADKTYSIVAKVIDLSNLSISNTTETYTGEKQEVQISLKDADLGMPEGLSASVVYKYTQGGTEIDPIDVGEYTVSATVSAKNSNYVLPEDYEITGTLTIIPATLRIALADTAVTESIYGGKIASYVKDTDFTVEGIVARDLNKDLGITVKAYKEYVEATETEVASKVELQAGDKVGTYPIKAEVADSNYVVEFAEVLYTIRTKPMPIPEFKISDLTVEDGYVVLPIVSLEFDLGAETRLTNQSEAVNGIEYEIAPQMDKGELANVATVSEDGKITFENSGKTRISITYTGDENHSSSRADFTIEVKPYELTVADFGIEETVVGSGKTEFTYTGKKQEPTVTYFTNFDERTANILKAKLPAGTISYEEDIKGAVEPINAGSYTAYINFNSTELANNTWFTGNSKIEVGKFIIAPAAQFELDSSNVARPADKTSVYSDNAEQGIDLSDSSKTYLSNNDINYNITYVDEAGNTVTRPTEVGTYYAKVEFTFDETSANNGNYLSIKPMTGIKLTITPKDITENEVRAEIKLEQDVFDFNAAMNQDFNVKQDSYLLKKDANNNDILTIKAITGDLYGHKIGVYDTYVDVETGKNYTINGKRTYRIELHPEIIGKMLPPEISYLLKDEHGSMSEPVIEDGSSIVLSVPADGVGAGALEFYAEKGRFTITGSAIGTRVLGDYDSDTKQSTVLSEPGTYTLRAEYHDAKNNSYSSQVTVKIVGDSPILKKISGTPDGDGYLRKKAVYTVVNSENLESMTVTVKKISTGEVETFNMNTNISNEYFTFAFSNKKLTILQASEELEITISCIGIKTAIDGSIGRKPDTELVLKLKPVQ
ncbi:MAG: hypothetical protein HFJ24_09205, partial [Clostridia bacterium]|nr:hypothetical protein [Clostridia bacterium]